MNQQPKLWQILSAFLPIIIGITAWLWNLSTTVERHSVRLDNIESNYNEIKQDTKEIKATLQTILIKMENKADRNNQYGK